MRRATPEEKVAARRLYEEDSTGMIVVNETAKAAPMHGPEGSWVEAWVWVPAEEIGKPYD